MKKILQIAAIALASLTSQVNAATVIDFEVGVAPASTGYVIADGYMGLNWDNFGVINTTDYSSSGYVNGVTSGSHIAYNKRGETAEISGIANSFLNWGGDFTAAWRDGLTLRVTGFSGLNQVFTQDYLLNSGGPSSIGGSLFGADRFVFEAFGGSEVNGYTGSGTHYALDNFTLSGVSAVPEPATWLMMILGFGLMGVASRRRTRIYA